jgi:hypothetical protein
MVTPAVQHMDSARHFAQSCAMLLQIAVAMAQSRTTTTRKMAARAVALVVTLVEIVQIHLATPH